MQAWLLGIRNEYACMFRCSPLILASFIALAGRADSCHLRSAAAAVQKGRRRGLPLVLQVFYRGPAAKFTTVIDPLHISLNTLACCIIRCEIDQCGHAVLCVLRGGSLGHGGAFVLVQHGQC